MRSILFASAQIKTACAPTSKCVMKSALYLEEEGEYHACPREQTSIVFSTLEALMQMLLMVGKAVSILLCPQPHGTQAWFLGSSLFFHLFLAL